MIAGRTCCKHKIHGNPCPEFFLKNLINLYMWVFCLHLHLRTTCMPGTRRCQKMMSDPWGLELQVVMSHYMYAGN